MDIILNNSIALSILALILKTLTDYTRKDDHDRYDELLMDAYAVYKVCNNRTDETKKAMIEIIEIHDNHSIKDMCIFSMEL